MDNAINILKKIKRIIIENAPYAKIYLYGSRARKDSHTESDWDILILLNHDKISNETEEKITDPLYDLEFETGQIISPMIYSENEWNSKYSITSFYHNIMKEGVLL